MDLGIGLLALIFLGLQILYLRYRKKRWAKYNNSNKIGVSELSSIVKIVAVMVIALFTAIYFILKFLNDNGHLS